MCSFCSLFRPQITGPGKLLPPSLKDFLYLNMPTTSTPHIDQKYIQALLDNDRRGIEEIYQRFADRITRFVTANQGTAKDAQDIFQEALIAIYQKARKEDFVLTCPFEAFLYLVCRGKWMNELRRRRKEGVTIEELKGFEEERDAHTMAEAAQREQEKDALFRKAFEHISEGCQKLIRLSWSGKSMEQVAQLLDISYAYARKKKSECIGKLMKRIKELPGFDRIVKGKE